MWTLWPAHLARLCHATASIPPVALSAKSYYDRIIEPPRSEERGIFAAVRKRQRCFYEKACFMPRSPLFQCLPHWLAAVSSIFLLTACTITEPGYNSGQAGPVDCKNFRIQGTREDLRPPNEKSCIIGRSDDAQVTGSGYIRFFEADNSYMMVLLETISSTGHFVLSHVELQGALAQIDLIKDQAVEWQDLPPLESNGHTYKLSRFRLSKVNQECIGFLTQGLVRAQGYQSRTSGFSCKRAGKGKLEITDIRKDLDGLRVTI